MHLRRKPVRPTPRAAAERRAQVPAEPPARQLDGLSLLGRRAGGVGAQPQPGEAERRSAFQPAIDMPEQAPGDLVAEHHRRREDPVEQLARRVAPRARARCRWSGPATRPARRRRGRRRSRRRPASPAPPRSASPRRGQASISEPEHDGDARAASAAAGRDGRGRGRRDTGRRGRRGAAPASRASARARGAAGGSPRRPECRRSRPTCESWSGRSTFASDLCASVGPNHHGTATASRPIAGAGQNREARGTMATQRSDPKPAAAAARRSRWRGLAAHAARDRRRPGPGAGPTRRPGGRHAGRGRPRRGDRPPHRGSLRRRPGGLAPADRGRGAALRAGASLCSSPRATGTPCAGGARFPGRSTARRPATAGST